MFILKKLFSLRDKQNNKFNDSEKPFLDHLDDLRSMLMKIIITLIVATIVTFMFNKQLLEIIQYPMATSGIPTEAAKMTGVLSPVEGFTTIIKICIYAGIVLTFPFLLYFIGEFVIPGLNDKEKKLILPSLGIGFALFLFGVVFSYFIVIPRALLFFYEFSAERGIEFDLRLRYYVSFVTQLTLVFGLCFELPVVVMVFVKLELLTYKLMSETRSYAIVIMFIVAAIITPTTDIFTLCLLAGPMIILYEICIWLAYFMEKKTKKLEAAEKAERQEWLKAKSLREGTTATEESDAETSSETAALPEKSSASDDSSTVTPKARTEVREFGYDPDNAIEHAGEDTSDVVDKPDSGEAQDSSTSEHFDHEDAAEMADSEETGVVKDEYGDDHWKSSEHKSEDYSSHDPSHDPYGNDHYHEDYYSGPTEELKRELREELIDELKGQIKAELRDELLILLRKELGISLKPKEEGDKEG